MAFDQETGKQDWNYRDYMRAKHEILEKYLKAWTQILWKFRRLLYVDCFAGKGKYDSGEYGSPIIALKAMEKILIKYPRTQAYALFIDTEQDNLDFLKQLIENEKSIENIKVECKKINYREFISSFEEIIPEQFQNVPTLIVLDPFGYSLIGLQDLAWFMSRKTTEFILTFMYRDLNRFLKTEHARKDIINVFGSDEILRLIKTEMKSYEREQTIIDFYINQLKNSAKVKFVQPFCVKKKIKTKHRTIYYLIHGTNHSKGLQVMKTIMNNIGGEEYTFYEKEKAKQKSLDYFFKGKYWELKQYLYEKFGNSPIVTIGMVRRSVLEETKYVDKDVTAVLKELEEKGEIEIIWPFKTKSYYYKGARIYFKNKKDT